jgi:hypothetical protein
MSGCSLDKDDDSSCSLSVCSDIYSDVEDWRCCQWSRHIACPRPLQSLRIVICYHLRSKWVLLTTS